MNLVRKIFEHHWVFLGTLEERHIVVEDIEDPS
jgi:hypothetical protein